MVWKSCLDPPNSLKSKYYCSTLQKKKKNSGAGGKEREGEKKAKWE